MSRSAVGYSVRGHIMSRSFLVKVSVIYKNDSIHGHVEVNHDKKCYMSNTVRSQRTRLFDGTINPMFRDQVTVNQLIFVAINFHKLDG